MTNTEATLRESGGAEHYRAICPACDLGKVTVFTAPKKPPKMKCTHCGWDSLEGGA